jgi:nucleoside-diphosphate-sugar epimerase
MKVLITGATGFLGRAIVDESLKNNLEVYTTAQTKQADDLPNYFPADISAAESLNKLLNLGEIDALIHAAGLAHQFKETGPEKFRKVNVEGTRNAANLAVGLKVKKFILISSVAVYGAAKKNSPNGFEEDLQCQPRGFYAESKFEAEKAAGEICSESAIDLTILRPSTIIGENDRGNVARLIRAINKRRFVWLGSGKNLKSLVYKTDVARVCLGFLESSGEAKNNKASVYNVTAEPISMREIVEEIEKALNKRVLPIHFPAKPLQKGLNLIGRASGIKRFGKIAETFEKWLSDDVFSGEKLKREIGFQTAVRSREGIRREALHYRKQK